LVLNVKDVLSQSGCQFWQILVTADSAEAFFRSQQPGDAPAVSHIAVTVTLHSPSHVTGSAEHGLNRVRCSKEASQVAFQAKLCDCQRFFKAFQKTVRGIGIHNR